MSFFENLFGNNEPKNMKESMEKINKFIDETKNQMDKLTTLLDKIKVKADEMIEEEKPQEEPKADNEGEEVKEDEKPDEANEAKEDEKPDEDNDAEEAKEDEKDTTTAQTNLCGLGFRSHAPFRRSYCCFIIL